MVVNTVETVDPQLEQVINDLLRNQQFKPESVTDVPTPILIFMARNRLDSIPSIHNPAERGRTLDETTQLLKLVHDSRQKTYELYYEMGRLFFEKGDTEHAIQSFDITTQLRPEYNMPHLYLGRIFSLDSNPQRGAYHFQQAFNLDMNHLVSLEHLAHSYSKMGKTDEMFTSIILESILASEKDDQTDLKSAKLSAKVLLRNSANSKSPMIKYATDFFQRLNNGIVPNDEYQKLGDEVKGMLKKTPDSTGLLYLWAYVLDTTRDVKKAQAAFELSALIGAYNGDFYATAASIHNLNPSSETVLQNVKQLEKYALSVMHKDEQTRLDSRGKFFQDYYGTTLHGIMDIKSELFGVSTDLAEMQKIDQAGCNARAKYRIQLLQNYLDIKPIPNPASPKP